MMPVFALCQSPSVVTHTKKGLGSFYFGLVIHKEKSLSRGVCRWAVAMLWFAGFPPSLLTIPRNLVEVQHLGLVLMSWNAWRFSGGCWNCSFTVTASLSVTWNLPLKVPFRRSLCVWEVAFAHPELQLRVLLVFWERTQGTLQANEVTVTVWGSQAMAECPGH